MKVPWAGGSFGRWMGFSAIAASACVLLMLAAAYATYCAVKNGLPSIEQLENIEPILGDVDDPNLPAGEVDLLLMVDVYHEFSHPYEMMQAICRGLKPGGRVAFVEYRAEDPDVPIKPLHKMSEAQVKKEMAVQPLEFVENMTELPWQHVIVFRKKGAD